MKKSTFLLALALSCGSSTAFAQDYERVWVDVNFGVAQSSQGVPTTLFTQTVFEERASASAVYDKPGSGSNLDFGGGYMFSPVMGVGLSYSGNRYKDPGSVSLTIPDPFFFNAASTGTLLVEDELERSERAFHMQAMINATPNSERLRVRLFGGPSYFRVQQHLVSDIGFVQDASPFFAANDVTLTGYEFKRADANAWGFHGGADVGMFFSRMVGVGGTVRYSRANVTLADPLSESNIDLKAGGVQVGGGLRFKF
jgi:opacity protein-like surface antigen